MNKEKLTTIIKQFKTFNFENFEKIAEDKINLCLKLIEYFDNKNIPMPFVSPLYSGKDIQMEWDITEYIYLEIILSDDLYSVFYKIDEAELNFNLDTTKDFIKFINHIFIKNN